MLFENLHNEIVKNLPHSASVFKGQKSLGSVVAVASNEDGQLISFSTLFIDLLAQKDILQTLKCRNVCITDSDLTGNPTVDL